MNPSYRLHHVLISYIRFQITIIAHPLSLEALASANVIQEAPRTKGLCCKCVR